VCRQKYFFVKVKDVELLVVHKMCTVSAPTEIISSPQLTQHNYRTVFSYNHNQFFNCKTRIIKLKPLKILQYKLKQPVNTNIFFYILYPTIQRICLILKAVPYFINTHIQNWQNNKFKYYSEQQSKRLADFTNTKFCKHSVQHTLW
jgi:hypothetical protein